MRTEKESRSFVETYIRLRPGDHERHAEMLEWQRRKLQPARGLIRPRSSVLTNLARRWSRPRTVKPT
jgi:hypothetical protein